MRKISLNGKWDALGKSPSGETINICGAVPGCSLNDILNEDGTDIFYRDNAEFYQKYENYNWKYTKKITVNSVGAMAKLVFERLDTYCDVYLNGTHIAHTENGNIAHSFDVTGVLKIGENVVEVCFFSPVEMVKDKKKYDGAFTTERLNTRRPQCTYGWDWTMRFVSCGIGRDAYIEIYDKPKAIKSAYIYTKSIDDECAVLGTDVELIKENANKIYSFLILDNENKVVKHIEKYCSEDFLRMDITIKEPKLWFPAGYGEQNLYTFLIKDEDEVLYSTEFGIRTAQIIEIPDEVGSESYNKCLKLKESPFAQRYDKNEEFSSFILKVNGKKIMCKGANWVPCQPFPMGNTDERITEILELSKSLGVNMIRVWGGGAFETEHFYNECSRLGIMVTQDFLMACGTYPEKEEWFIEELKKEAEYASLLLRNKACLMWWSGDNENAVDGCEKDSDYKGRDSMYKAIAPVLYKNDPYRRVLASSPYGGDKYASNTMGTTHNTQYLGWFFQYIEKTDMKDYKEYFKMLSARFIAEETCFGAVDYNALKNFMTDEDIFGNDMKMWYYHTQSNPGLGRELLDYALEFTHKVLGDFKDSEDKFFKYKYLQYEWIRVSFERARRDMWFCSGIIYWMLNDCWPASSGWAIIDYYNKPKAAFYSFKRCAKNILASLDFEDDKYNLYLCNDGKEQQAKVKIYRISKDEVKLIAQKDVMTKAESSYIALTMDKTLNDNEIFVGEVITENGDFSRCFYKKGDLEISPAKDSARIIEINDEYIKIKAENYIHIVEIEGAVMAEDNYFQMMPGEEKTVKIAERKGDLKLKSYTLNAIM